MMDWPHGSISEPSGICTGSAYTGVMTPDPSAIRSVAVSAEDLLAAIEADARGEATAVLRVTPPFSGRMRARLHVVQDDAGDETVHIPPAALVDDDAPAYPLPDETADELRAAPDEAYSVDRHREYHEQQVDQWRETLLDHVVSSVTVPGTNIDVQLSVLGP